jgi:hypothetical protein
MGRLPAKGFDLDRGEHRAAGLQTALGRARPRPLSILLATAVELADVGQPSWAQTLRARMIIHEESMPSCQVSDRSADWMVVRGCTCSCVFADSGMARVPELTKDLTVRSGSCGLRIVKRASGDGESGAGYYACT